MNDRYSFCFDKTCNKRLYSAPAGYKAFSLNDQLIMPLNNILPGLIRMKFFLCVLGMVMILEGLPYFAFPEKMKLWIQKVAQTPDGALRRIGLVLMAFGLVLVYLGRQ